MSLYRIKCPKKASLMETIMLFVLATFPFINLYATPISSLGISDVILLLMLLYYFVVALRRPMVFNSVAKYRFLLICFIVINFIVVICYSAGYMYLDIFFRTLRYIIYMSVGLVFPISHERREKIRKIIIASSLFATVVLIVENMVYRLFGVYIPGFIPSMPLLCEEAINEQVKNIYIMGGRPFSFFSEPSAYGMYVGLCLVLVMLIPGRDDHFFIRWFLTGGLILSGSTTGLSSVLVVYAVVFIKRLMHHNMRFFVKEYLFAITLLPLGIYILLSSSSVQSMIIRIINGGSSYDRIEGYKVFGIKYSIEEILFGHGMNDNIEDFFMSSFPRLYYYWGILGIIIISGLLIWLFKRIDRESKIVFLFVLFLNIATGWSWGQFNLVSYALVVPVTTLGESMMMKEDCLINE